MAKWASSDVLDNGPQKIITLAGTAARVKQHLIKAYTAGDSYATVIANSLGSYDMTAGDLVMSTGGSSSRVLTVGAKSGNQASADSGASPNLHFALVDSTGSAVLIVTDESTDQVINTGTYLSLGSWTYTSAQPT